MRASLQQDCLKAPIVRIGAFLFARNATKLGPLRPSRRDG